jgi:hypothetical protein
MSILHAADIWTYCHRVHRGHRGFANLIVLSLFVDNAKI